VARYREDYEWGRRKCELVRRTRFADGHSLSDWLLEAERQPSPVVAHGQLWWILQDDAKVTLYQGPPNPTDDDERMKCPGIFDRSTGTWQPTPNVRGPEVFKLHLIEAPESPQSHIAVIDVRPRPGILLCEPLHHDLPDDPSSWGPTMLDFERSLWLEATGKPNAHLHDVVVRREGRPSHFAPWAAWSITTKSTPRKRRDLFRFRSEFLAKASTTSTRAPALAELSGALGQSLGITDRQTPWLRPGSRWHPRVRPFFRWEVVRVKFPSQGLSQPAVVVSPQTLNSYGAIIVLPCIDITDLNEADDQTTVRVGEIPSFEARWAVDPLLLRGMFRFDRFIEPLNPRLTLDKISPHAPHDVEELLRDLYG
jgi:hypothetical protein